MVSALPNQNPMTIPAMMDEDQGTPLLEGTPLLGRVVTIEQAPTRQPDCSPCTTAKCCRIFLVSLAALGLLGLFIFFTQTQDTVKSIIGKATPVTHRSADSGFENNLATRVCRWISLLTLSIPFEVRTRYLQKRCYTTKKNWITSGVMIPTERQALSDTVLIPMTTSG